MTLNEKVEVDAQSNQSQMAKANSNAPKNRKTVSLWLTAPVLVLIICAGCFLIWWNFLWPNFGCYDYRENRLTSPNGQHQAVTFLSDCGGAPASDAPEVSILRTGQKLYHFQRGNVFIGSYGCSYLKVKWITDNQLEVWYGIGQDVAGRTILPISMKTEKDDISIIYQLEPTCSWKWAR